MMKRRYKVRRPVTIDRQWFGAEEFRPRLHRSLMDSVTRLFGRSLALVG